MQYLPSWTDTGDLCISRSSIASYVGDNTGAQSAESACTAFPRPKLTSLQWSQQAITICKQLRYIGPTYSFVGLTIAHIQQHGICRLQLLC